MLIDVTENIAELVKLVLCRYKTVEMRQLADDSDGILAQRQITSKSPMDQARVENAGSSA